MNELSIEQKAKAYDELFIKAKQIYNKENDVLIMHTIEDLFPEVKEPDDERIRQKVIKLVKMSNAIGGYALHKWEADEMLAWLEKQGEQKPDEWSEEDEKKRECLIKGLEDRMGFGWASDPFSREEYIDWLKSLRPLNTYNPYKAVVESIAEMCKHYDGVSHIGLRDFYDNVKVKCKDAKEYDKMFPQAQWKPSEEQIKVCKEVYADILSAKGFDLGTVVSELNRMEEQLKKLKKK